MATLWGQDGSSWSSTLTESQQSSGNAVAFSAGYTASAGLASVAWVQFGSGVTATSAKLCIYDHTGALVGTASFASCSGLQSASVSISLTAQTYFGILVPNSGYFNLTYQAGSSNFVADQWTSGAFSFASPPSTKPAASVHDNGHEYQIWLAGSIPLPASGNVYSYGIGNAALTYTSGTHAYALVALPLSYHYVLPPSDADVQLTEQGLAYGYSLGAAALQFIPGSFIVAGDALYPTNIRGLTPEVTRTPMFNTGRRTAQSGRESRIAFRQYPLIHFELKYDVLRDDLTISDLKSLVGLHNSAQGQLDSFLFTDPDFNTVSSGSPQTIGTSTGLTNTTYQLVAVYQNPSGPGVAELVQNLNGTPVIYDNGTPIATNHYTIGPTGLVQFTVSPTAGHTISWSGSFFYRCAFDDDALEVTKFMNKGWTATVKFTSVIL